MRLLFEFISKRFRKFVLYYNINLYILDNLKLHIKRDSLSYIQLYVYFLKIF